MFYVYLKKMFVFRSSLSYARLFVDLATYVHWIPLFTYNLAPALTVALDAGMTVIKWNPNPHFNTTCLYMELIFPAPSPHNITRAWLGSVHQFKMQQHGNNQNLTNIY